MKNDGYVKNVDELITETSLDAVLVHYGRSPSNLQSGEYRMNCVFNADCQTSSYGNLAINLSHPAKQIFCHVCGTRGNLLTLIHGLETQTPPTTGKLRGQEFKHALQRLREIRGLISDTRTQIDHHVDSRIDSGPASRDPHVPKRNLPLARHANEGARKIADLCDDLIVDPARMSPAAAGYVRARPWMTEEVMRKWGVGYLPRDGRSMFRGLFVYTHRNQQGEPISYSARDPLFEEKQAAWLRQGNPTPPKQPLKHKYVKGFARGLELYGQQVERLDEPHVQASLDRNGLVVVEGANDVIRLDTLGIAAIGLCSNRATDAQIEKIRRFASAMAGGRVLLMPDNDSQGEAGFKELLWALSEIRLETSLAWSRCMSEGAFEGLQPEMISDDDRDTIFG